MFGVVPLINGQEVQILIITDRISETADDLRISNEFSISRKQLINKFGGIL